MLKSCEAMLLASELDLKCIDDYLNPDVVMLTSHPEGAGSFVYVIKPVGHDCVKVGSAEIVSLRLKELQCGAWAKLEVAGAIGVLSGRALTLEKAAHKRLSAKRLTGEWFSCTPKEAVETVLLAAIDLGVKIASEPFIRELGQLRAKERSRAHENDRRAKMRLALGMA